MTAVTLIDFVQVAQLPKQFLYKPISGKRDEVVATITRDMPWIEGAIYYHVPTATAYIPADWRRP